jgi:23S rRNA (uracil1939-C5)-methyltransferase
VAIRFLPTDFTQVNLALNRAMVDRALALLDPQPGERVLDLFCGLGNFTLPIARRGAQVVGVEGEPGLVARAQENAQRNGIGNVELIASDLAVEFDNAHWLEPGYDKVLLDPPRSGAWTMLPHIARAGARRIVYVSCHPGTLARDAGALVARHGYRLVRAGVMDMFPHTAHVESIALFERN